MAPFDIGDVVVCVDDRANPDFGPSGLKRGSLYRVRSVGPVGYSRLMRAAGPSIRVDGVGDEHGWLYARRFRKIDAEVTEEFREQLRKLPKPARERADA